MITNFTQTLRSKIAQSFKQKNKSHACCITILIFILVCLPSLLLCQRIFKDDLGEGYFFYSKKYPSESANSWANDNWAPNGIAHDDANWYICSGSKGFDGLTPCKTNNKDYTIWKIPRTTDLNSDFNDSNSGVRKWQKKHLNNPPDNHFTFYGHAGDLDCFIYGGVYYLAVPITGNNEYRDSIDSHGNIVLNPQGFAIQVLKRKTYPAIAFFRARDLKLLNYVELRDQRDVGWCAVHPITKKLYTSNDETHVVYRYDIDWSVALSVSEGNAGNHRGLSGKEIINLGHYTKANPIKNMQGGEFTPTGNLLYISSGLNGEPNFASDGIHAFYASGSTSWSIVTRSTNSVMDPLFPGCFNFTFDNNGWLDQEPEGLTIWPLGSDVENMRYTQLHVLVDDHNCFNEINTKVFLHHFRSFNCSNDITVYGTQANGEPKTNSRITDFLDRGGLFEDCGIIKTTNPSIFPPGKTAVKFTTTVNPFFSVQCEANVNIVAEYDECSRAMLLSSCDRKITNNYCADLSKNIPTINSYNGPVKDVWFKINPPSSKTPSFSIETYQIIDGLTHTVVQVLSGACGNLREIASDDGRANGGHAKVTIQNTYGSAPLYIRVTDYGADEYAKFGICYKKIATGSEMFSQQLLSVFPTEGESVFNRPVLKGDINGDGKTDLIFQYTNSDGELCARTKISDGNGGYTTVYQNLGDRNSVLNYPTLTGDIDGDGKTDLILTYLSSTDNKLRIRVKLSNGDGYYRVPAVYPFVSDLGSSIFNRPVLTGDIDNDGKTDLIFQYKSTTTDELLIRAMFSKGNGDFDNPVAFKSEDGDIAMSHPTLTGDIDGDGKTDLILTYYYQGNGLTVRVKLANGDGTFRMPKPYVLGDGNGVFDYPVLTGDVDGDGRTDLIFVGQDWNGNTNLSVRVKFSNGDGTFRKASQVLGDGVGVHAYPTLTGDLNGDGREDLIFVGDGWTGCGLNIRVKISDGLGGWCPDWQVTGEGASVLKFPIAGDVNGDGKIDLIFPYHLTGEGLKIRTKIIKSNYSCNNQIATEEPVISTSSGFLIYPNPSGTYFQIRSVNQQTVQLKIMNAQGVIVVVYPQFNSDIDRVDVSRFQNGIYLVEIFNSETHERSANKFVKIN